MSEEYYEDNEIEEENEVEEEEDLLKKYTGWSIRE
jgi:hypothetical protein